MLGKIFKHASHFEDNMIAIGGAWVLGPLLGTLAGFYLTTIFRSQHDVDLQLHDIQTGFIGAGAGLALGVLFAIWVTVVYPRSTRRDGDVDKANS